MCILASLKFKFIAEPSYICDFTAKTTIILHMNFVLKRHLMCARCRFSFLRRKIGYYIVGQKWRHFYFYYHFGKYQPFVSRASIQTRDNGMWFLSVRLVLCRNDCLLDRYFSLFSLNNSQLLIKYMFSRNFPYSFHKNFRNIFRLIFFV